MPGELSSHLAPGKATPHLGVVLTNLGSPDAPTASGLRAFYAEFLSDRCVIEVPRIIWNCILWLFILPFRPFVVAKLYRSIWWPEGSPLTVLSERLREKVDTKLAERFGKDTIKVVSGMRYGNPSISKVMTELKDAHVSRLLVLPLYPQAAAATGRTLSRGRWSRHWGATGPRPRLTRPPSLPSFLHLVHLGLRHRCCPGQ